MVKPNRSIPSPTVVPVLTYPDVREAVRWLSEAFGFEERLQIGESHRSQLPPATDTLQFCSASDWPGGVNPACLMVGTCSTT